MCQIRAMKAEDVSDVVRIHLAAFPNFFLTFLGKNFLREFYRLALPHRATIALVFGEPEIQAFVFGSSNAPELYHCLIRNYWWQFGLASLSALLRQPGILPRLMRAFAMQKQETRARNCATLISIAVEPACQGGGRGKQLVDAFLREADQQDCKHVTLVTDALDNDSANAFYRKMGFTLSRTFTTPEGRHMNEYMFTYAAAATP